MKFTILIESRAQNSQQEICENPDYRTAKLPYEAAPELIVEGACPSCEEPLPEFRVKGDERSKVQKDERTFYCVAYCTHCRTPVGTLKVESQTIFGADEDRAVLQGRPRVY